MPGQKKRAVNDYNVATKVWSIVQSSWTKIKKNDTNFSIATPPAEPLAFPHAVGAIDGKHVATECLSKSTTVFYNYKSFYSTALPAICDAKYNFILFDTDQYGSNNDCGVLSKSSMGMLHQQLSKHFYTGLFLYIGENLYHTNRHITRGGRGEVSLALFQKLEKSAPMLGKNALIVTIYGLNFSCSLKSFQEKKTKFYHAGLFFHAL